MLYRGIVVAALCSACGFQHGAASNGGGTIDADPTGDGPRAVDASNVSADARQCFGTFVNVCLTALPTAPRDLTAVANINTDADCTQTQAQTGGPELCVIAA